MGLLLRSTLLLGLTLLLLASVGILKARAFTASDGNRPDAALGARDPLDLDR